MSDVPPLPPGFTLDNQTPPLPTGFTLDSQQQAPQRPQKLGWRDILRASSIAMPTQVGAPVALAEGAANFGTGMVAAPVAGLAGLAQGAKNLIQGDPSNMSAGDRVTQVQGALTYQPRTGGGEAVAETVAAPFEALAKGAKAVGNAVNEFNPGRLTFGKGVVYPDKQPSHPLAATATETAINMLPALFLRGKGATANAAADAATRAETYVRTRTRLDWAGLPDQARTRLTEIAKDQRTLDALDPKALERQIQLESLPVPIRSASKGQLNRDPRQLQQEELLKSTDAGKELVGDALDQNRKISENIDFLRNKTGGKPLSDMELGRSLQDKNLRAKQSSVKAEVEALYDEAEAAGEKAGPVDSEPLRQWLKDPLNRENLPALEKGLKAYAREDGALTVKQLEDIRQDINAERATPGKSAFYAKKAIAVIDDVLDKSGGPLYKKARAAYKAERVEFRDQAAVQRLVKDKTRTDRQTALEDTHNKVVVQGSVEQLVQVRDSLTKGGTPETRSRGVEAWKDLAATTIEKIKAEATKGVSNQSSEANSTYVSLKRAIDRVGDEKLELLIGKESTTQLRQVLKAAETLKTEPGGTGVRGSNTVNKIMNILDKTLITKIPGIGPTAEGVIRGVGKVAELGKGGREVRAAKQQPLDARPNKLSATQEEKNMLRRTTLLTQQRQDR